MTAKGMTPIEKNVVVVDSQGNILEATYPKRAKGLVKNGRARFIDENKICLACPPKNLEENQMTYTEKDFIIDKMTGEILETANKDTHESSSNPELTVEYILSQLEKISSQTDYLSKAIAWVSDMQVSGAGDIATQGKASAIASMVNGREVTNQRLIAFYEKMYDQLTSEKYPDKELAKDKINALSRIFELIDWDDLASDDIVKIIERFI